RRIVPDAPGDPCWSTAGGGASRARRPHRPRGGPSGDRLLHPDRPARDAARQDPPRPGRGLTRAAASPGRDPGAAGAAADAGPAHPVPDALIHARGDGAVAPADLPDPWLDWKVRIAR